MPETEQMQKERVLVVDDLPANIDYLAESLQEEYQVSVAISGVDALRCAQSESRPDIILLDVMMPGMDGYTVCKALKDNLHTRDIPIIFVTARNTPEDELIGLQAGAIDYVRKPVNVPTVKARISSQLELKRSRERLGRQAAELDAINQKLTREIEERKKTEAILLRRDTVLDAVHFAAEQLALVDNWHEVIPQLVSRLGRSAEVSRTYICQLSPEKSKLKMSKNCYIWEEATNNVKTGCVCCQEHPDDCQKLKSYKQAVDSGQQLIGLTKDMPLSLQEIIRPQGVKSTAIRPIMVEKKLWGFMGFDDCKTDRNWSSPEIDALNTAAHIVGAAIYRRQVEEKLKIAKDVAVRASQAKTQFLASMSHEIRTPMNAIIGMTGLALDSQLNSKQRHCLDIAFNSANALLGLLNDILDFSKVEAGQLLLENSSFMLQEALEMAIKTLQYNAGQKGLEIHLDIPPTLPAKLMGDELRLRQILLNLISNAIKFTDQGEIQVRVEIQEKNKNDVFLQFMVKDSGTGIPAEKQQAIFNAFSQADSSISRLYGGTGLGLSIARSLTTLMDGEIWVDSEMGVGSTFQFTARFNLPPPETKETVGARQKSKVLREGAGAKESQDRKAGATVVQKSSHDFLLLVVEDNYANQQLAKLLLEDNGYRVFLAGNGIEALHAISKRSYDLVLMDMQMPKMDGIAASQYIRACEHSQCEAIGDDRKLAADVTARLREKHLPVIAMTANAMGSDKQKCLAAGMDEYITKPILPDNIFATLDRFLGKCERRNSSEGGLAADYQKAKEDGRLKEVRRFLLDKVRLEKSKITPLLDLFCQNHKITLADLKKSQKNNDLKLLCRTAHTIKGAILNLGMEDMAEIALEIERESKKGSQIDYAVLIQKLEDGLGFLLH